MKSFKEYFTEETQKTVVIYPGAFKPPHKGHYEVLKELIDISNAQEAIVYIGTKIREGADITAEQSKQIWKIYTKHLSIPCSIEISSISPVKSAYDYIDSHPDQTIFVGAGEKDMVPNGRFGSLIKNKIKYSNVEVISVPPKEGGISGTQTRNAIQAGDSDIVNQFTPSEMSDRDKDQIKKILNLD